MKKSHNFSLNYQNIIEQEVLVIGTTNKRERKRERNDNFSAYKYFNPKRLTSFTLLARVVHIVDQVKKQLNCTLKNQL